MSGGKALLCLVSNDLMSSSSHAFCMGRFCERQDSISCRQTLSIAHSTQTSSISRRVVNSAIEPSVSSQPMNVSSSASSVLIPKIHSSVHSLLKVIVLNSSK